MKVIYSDRHQAHQGGMELHRGELVPCYEMPSRAQFMLDALRQAGFPILPPRDFAPELLERVHSADYLQFLRTAYSQWQAAGKSGFMLPSAFPARGQRQDKIPTGIHAKLGYYSYDASTPMVEGTWQAVEAGAHCALTAAALVAAGERSAYALCRPPGHHAGFATFGGYCFLNNAALAAQYLRDQGKQKVVVLDVDYHHGNGTQDIFWQRDDVLTISIHGDPATEHPFFLGYADEQGEGAGFGYCHNFPLPAGTDWPTYQQVLLKALQLIKDFNPDAMVVSLGVDTFEDDPISAFQLKSEHYPLLGAHIASLGLPTVFIQEGGYAVAEVGQNVAAVLQGFEQTAHS